MNKSITELRGISNEIVSSYEELGSYSAVARLYQTSPATVRRIVIDNGSFETYHNKSKINQAKKLFTKEQIQKIYLEHDRKQLVEILGVPYNSIQHLLKWAGCYDIDKRYVRNERKKNLGQKNPFDNGWLHWYIVGFFLGDGSLGEKSKGYYTLNFTCSDESVIAKIAEAFGIKYYKKFSKKGTVPLYSCESTLQEAAKYLIGIGFKLRKSISGMDLPSVPDAYMGAFLLGLLDSDGCISVSQKNMHFRWYGHPAYMDQLYKKLTTLGLSGTLYRVQDKLAGISIKYSERIEQLLYQNAEFYLSRKRQRITKYKHWDKCGKFIDEEYHIYV